MSYILDMTNTTPSPASDTSVPDGREPMTVTEISRWALLVLVIATCAGYAFTVFPQLAERDAGEIGWQIPMIWAIGIQMVGTIVLSIIMAIVAGIITRREPENADVRDKQIERHGDRIARAIAAFGCAAVLVLVMLELDWFWIGNALFAIGAIGAMAGAIASIRAYHGVFRG